MMIKCKRHGFGEAIQVSPDLRKQMDAGKIDEYAVVHYEYNDEIVDSFFLSVQYAARHKLQSKFRLPLPDDYPEWVNGLVLVCKKCFENCIISQ